MDEIWKDIPELNGKYQCSNYGRIRRVNKDPRCRKFRYLKLQLWKSGYFMVNPTRTYRRVVHRIVGELFIDNPNNKPCINHIDGNPQNNFYKNLEWCTYKENTQHAIHVLKTVYCRSRKPVINIKTGERFKSIKDAALYYGCCYKYLANIIKHKSHLTNMRYAEACS